MVYTVVRITQMVPFPDMNATLWCQKYCCFVPLPESKNLSQGKTNIYQGQCSHYYSWDNLRSDEYFWQQEPSSAPLNTFARCCPPRMAILTNLCPVISMFPSLPLWEDGEKEVVWASHIITEAWFESRNCFLLQLSIINYQGHCDSTNTIKMPGTAQITLQFCL